MNELLLPLMGVAGYIALHHLWLWLGRRSETLYLWVAAWSLDTLLYLVSHFIQISSGNVERAVLGGRLAWVSAFIVLVVVVGLSYALAGRPAPRRLLAAVTAVSATLLVVHAFTEAIVTRRTYIRTDALGREDVGLLPGPLMSVVAPYIVLVFVYCFRVVWRATGLRPGERRVILCGFVVYAAFGLNDVLHVARLIQSIRLFDYAFVAVAVGLTYLLVRRHNRLSTHLEDEVSARTEQLAALERAGRTVMAGLDLDTTLRRIVDEAARMATVARVKLALLDPRTRALAVAAVSGGPAGAALPGPTVESVAVARSGEPLIAPRYLGVPIAAGDEVLGVLAFDHAGPHDYSLQDLAVLRSFADQAAIAIVNARIYAAEGAARREAEEALAQVKQLQGMLPICAWCKRVRNDRNYWEQIEVYVSERTDARFTHGICPDCRAKVRPRPAGTA